MSNEHNFFRKILKENFISPFIGAVLEDRILELEEDLNQCLDMGDKNKIDSILVELDRLYMYKHKTKDQNNNENEQKFDPEHLFDDIDYFKDRGE